MVVCECTLFSFVTFGLFIERLASGRWSNLKKCMFKNKKLRVARERSIFSLDGSGRAVVFVSVVFRR